MRVHTYVRIIHSKGMPHPLYPSRRETNVEGRIFEWKRKGEEQRKKKKGETKNEFVWITSNLAT